MCSSRWLVLLVACAGRPPVVDVPQHMRARAATAPEPRAYSVKLNDGKNEWSIALPPVNGGYEVRIPAGAADVDAKKKVIVSKDSIEYKTALGRVQALFAKKSYELALGELVRLRADFPDDAKLAAMEWTLYFKLGDKEKAQRAWEKAMELDPENNTIVDMLQGIK